MSDYNLAYTCKSNITLYTIDTLVNNYWEVTVVSPFIGIVRHSLTNRVLGFGQGTVVL